MIVFDSLCQLKNGERRRDGGDIKNACCSSFKIHAEFFVRLRTTTNKHKEGDEEERGEREFFWNTIAQTWVVSR